MASWSFSAKEMKFSKVLVLFTTASCFSPINFIAKAETWKQKKFGTIKSFQIFLNNDR